MAMVVRSPGESSADYEKRVFEENKIEALDHQRHDTALQEIKNREEEARIGMMIVQVGGCVTVPHQFSDYQLGLQNVVATESGRIFRRDGHKLIRIL